MKPEKKHINSVRKLFSEIENKKDLLNVFNLAVYCMYGDKGKEIELKHLTFYSNLNVNSNRYKSFYIPKKSGGKRKIDAPVAPLKSLLKTLNFIIQCLCEPHKAANGFVIDRSIVSNANVHTGKNYVYNIDLENFFPSFDRNTVKLGFMRAPFSLKGDKEPLAFLLACLTTNAVIVEGGKQFTLPQGSPASPSITNHLCATLDRRLNGLAKKLNLSYSRYADDITFSSDHHVYNKAEFLDELNRIIEDQKLKINPSKTQKKKKGYKQEVTGLTVNEKVNISRKYVKQIRTWLHVWEKDGLENAQAFFINKYLSEKGHVKSNKATLTNVLDGKLEFLKMVKGPENSTYLKLKGRFEVVSGTQSETERLITMWEEKGIEIAIKMYYTNNS